jgi:glycosyltransferase involved in cell wall biosynthesis
MQINPCIIVPIYNNKDTIRGVVQSLEYLELPCLIVDDGSDEATREILAGIQSDFSWVTVIRRFKNGGKGAAMKDGFLFAHYRDYSHAVQLDADGQHDAADIPRFLKQAGNFPDALILGQPIFDREAPVARRYGRLITTFWVSVETLSLQIKDALCGYRCYPIVPVIALYRRINIGSGMVFDTEIAVRLSWRGVRMVNVETRVSYSQGGISHFHYLKDNLRIICLHTKLVFGMLPRLPRLVFRPRL